ncbi:MAG: NADPH:quinone oxidoreductase family protein [Solirubrobacteraceae bacterium]
MRAIQVTRLDGPAALAVRDVAAPPPGDGVLIDVECAGVSFPDLLLSRGQYQFKPEPPFTLGVEAAGVVREAPAASGFANGDRVATFAFGSWAEQLLAPAATTFALPPQLNFEQGAGLLMNYHTALFALDRRAAVRPGESVLVHGAAGGVGSAAIQVALALGARVIAVVSSEAKRSVAREAGASEVLLTESDWRGQARELTGGSGVDVVFDPVGGERTVESLRTLARGGRLIVIGFAEGAIPSVALNRVLLRNISIVGAAWGEWIAAWPQEMGVAAEQLSAMIETGHVRPLVGACYPMSEASRALLDLEGRRATGKLVLRCR